MPVRGLRPIVIDEFMGMDGFNDEEELAENVFNDALNVCITPNSNVAALRSPANFNNPTSNSKPILSEAFYDRAAGGLVFFDLQQAASTNVDTYYTTGTTNTSIRTGQANARWQSINVNDRLYRVNGTEFIQYVNTPAAYAVGISAPLAAPTVSFVSGGSLVVNSGVTVSYAYRNSTTLHVGQASPVSLASGASTSSNKTLRVGVTASSQPGVDGIVLFVTVDGGSVRYLLVDSSGNPIVYPNTTGNIDLSTANMLDSQTALLNYNVPETVFNAPPPPGLTFITEWKSRIFGFKGRSVFYSGYDQIFYGQPWEAWPPLNEIPIPSKSEFAMGGTSTAIGLLVLSDRDAYLISGAPTDKVDSGINTIQVSEQMDPLDWQVGTRSPLTIKNCPFGTIWLDQDKHLQLWRWQGMAEEICPGLRKDLVKIQDSDTARAMAEAEWHSFGDTGGFYVLTASTTGTTNNRCWIITVIMRGGTLFIGGCPSDITAQCITKARLAGKWRTFIGQVDRMREILDFTLQGAGWGSSVIYCEAIIGNHAGNFSAFHSLRYDGSNVAGVRIQTRRLDDTDIRGHTSRKEDGAMFCSIHRDGTRFKLRFNFATDDAAIYEVKNFRASVKGKVRAI